MPIYPKRLRNGVGSLAFGSSPCDLTSQLDIDFRPPNPNTVSSRPHHPCLGPLADLLCLDFRQRREQCQQDIAHQLVVCRQMRFGVAMERDAMARQPLEMQDRLSHPLAAKSIQRPK